jgi:hypothetical protein
MVDSAETLLSKNKLGKTQARAKGIMEKFMKKTTSEKCDCLYCGEKSDSIDPRVLCKDCRETFGHTFFEEL